MRNSLSTLKSALLATALFSLAGCVRDSIPKFEVNNLDVPDEARSAEYERKKTAPAGPAEPVVALKKASGAEPSVARPKAPSAKGRLLTPCSFVTKWNFLGPFKFSPGPGETEADSIHRAFVEDEAGLDGNITAPEGTRWTIRDFLGDSPMGEIKMRSIYEENDKDLVAYAVCYLYSPEDIDDATLYIGSGGFVKVWVNKKLVHAYNRNGRKPEWDQDAIKNVPVQRGYNLVVVKCAAHDGEWSFYFRIATAADVPVGVFKPAEVQLQTKP